MFLFKSIYYFLQNITGQGEERDLAIVKKNGYDLVRIRKQTPKICLEAVKEYSGAILFVNDSLITTELCLVAINQNPDNLIRIKNQTLEVCLVAVKKNIHSYDCINTPIMRNKVSSVHLIDVCIGLKNLQLPSYVLMDVVDVVLMKNTLADYSKINNVIQINEKKL